jgi:hypothetical protein
MRNFHQLVDTVQKNCHITDARYAQNMTMCTYLLEMRQYYRWEHDVPYSRNLPKDELGDWLIEREQLWSGLEEGPYAPLPIDSGAIDPFDTEGINRELLPEGYVYSGGYGRFHKPHFFLGSLDRIEQRSGFTVLIAGCEYARDLIAPPAALQNDTIFLRYESVRRFIWEKFEEWQWRKRDDRLGRAFDYYDFANDIDHALERMARAESEAMILHEVGEGLAGRLLGERWADMIGALTKPKSEIVARAVRDHLADCVSTLPALLEREAESSLHFYFANFEGMRRELFPAAMRGYQAWVKTGATAQLLDAVERGRAHWEKTAERLLDIYSTNRARCDDGIDDLLREKTAEVRL